MAFILFILGYYLVWFSTLFLASAQYAYTPLVLSLIMSLCQFAYLFKEYKPFYCLISALLFTLIGFTIDTLFVISHLIEFKLNPWQPFLAPPWILALWLNFSVLCLGILPFLKRIFLYLWLIALIGFPTAYSAGIQFNLIHFSYGVIGLTLLGSCWMLIFPCVCRYILFKQVSRTHFGHQ